MITVQDILKLSSEIDMKRLGHHAFWALKEGKVLPTEDANRLNEIDYDEEAVEAMIAQNVLEIGKIQLYVIETRTPELYAFYFAENVLAASMLHEDLFKERPKRIVNGDDLMGTAFEFDDQDEGEILFIYRSQISLFPYYLGHAWAGERVFYRDGV